MIFNVLGKNVMSNSFLWLFLAQFDDSPGYHHDAARVTPVRWIGINSIY